MAEDCVTVDKRRGVTNRDGEESGDAEQSRGDHLLLAFVALSERSHDRFFSHLNSGTSEPGARRCVCVCEFERGIKSPELDGIVPWV